MEEENKENRYGYLDDGYVRKFDNIRYKGSVSSMTFKKFKDGAEIITEIITTYREKKA